MKNLRDAKVLMTKTATITSDDIHSLFVSAIEGGSNYWCKSIVPLKRTDKSKEYTDRFYNDVYKHGFKAVDNEDGVKPLKEYIVKPEKFYSTLNLMAAKEPRHFEDLTEDGRADSDTGDVYLQLMVFGKVIYG